MTPRLPRLLDPYVEAHGLGYIYRPHAILPRHGSEVEPDLMVSRSVEAAGGWDTAPTPSLIVEILFPSTRRRDHAQKREFYLEESVPDYWIVDPERRTIRCIRPGREDVLAEATATWFPQGVDQRLVIRLNEIFAAN